MKAVQDAFFVACPSERAFLSGDEAEWIRASEIRGNRAPGVFPRARALELAIAVEWPHGPRQINLIPALICACCGKTNFQTKLSKVSHDQWRCDVHVGRNPCAVVGCGRSWAARQPALDQFLCGRHWRPVPRQMKNVHARIRRLVKKSGGWTNLLWRRERRIWARIIAAAQKAVDGGDLDMALIEREFGL